MSEVATTVAPLPLSVVIPAFRRADLVARAVTSAFSQNPPPDEVIVVDDCSGDDTADAARRAGATVIVHEVNGGEGASRDTGVAAARHDWIAFLDSDDAWLDGHLAALWPHRQTCVLAGTTGRGSRDGRLYGNSSNAPRRLMTPRDVILPTNCLTPSGVMAFRPALIAAGGFSRRRHVADLDTWIRVLEQGPGVSLPDITFLYEQHDGQVSLETGPMAAALLEVISSYRTRPWWSTSVLRRAEAMPLWDDLRRALRLRDVRRIGGDGLRLLHPQRAAGLAVLLAARRRGRARRIGGDDQ